MDIVINGILIATLAYLVLLVLMGSVLLFQAIAPKLIGRRQHDAVSARHER